MTAARSIMFECHGYRGETSHERCRAVEEYVMECIEGECRIESVTMREICVGGDAVQPTIDVVYSRAGYKKMISLVDEALSEANLVAAQVLVSTVVSHVESATVAGAELGGMVGGAAGSMSGRGRRGSAVGWLAGTVVGAVVGRLAGKAAEERIPNLVGVKQSGKWYLEKVPRQID